MEFLKHFKRRSFLNELIYVTLNICLAIALMVIVRVTGLIWPALILVLLSKWRIFAVRPQFWFANIQANLVSLIVSISYVVFIYDIEQLNIGDAQVLILQLFLAALDACWLLFLKPKSKRKYIIIQAGVALFVGITAVYSISYMMGIATPVVLLMWLIGYATSKHILSNYDEEDRVVLLSLSWGVIIAEIGWVAYHWTIAYRLFVSSLSIPQVSIIVLCMSFLAYKIYNSFYHYQKIRMNDIVLPLIFTVAIILVLILGFNGVTTIVS